VFDIFDVIAPATENVSDTVSDPATYRLIPGGGDEIAPTVTPAPYATFPWTVVHWDDVIAMFEAAVTLPYVSTITRATFAADPY